MSFSKKLLSRFVSDFYKITPSPLLEKIISKKRGLAVLMYHSTPAAKSSYMYSTMEINFRFHLEILNKYFKVVSLQNAYKLIENKKLIQEKPIAVITFDDGYKNNFTVAYQHLKRFNFPFTVFLTTNFIDSKHSTFLNWEETKFYASDPLVTFGAHTITHLSLKLLETEDIKKEIIESKTLIQNVLNKSVDFFAYPSGSHTPEAVEIVQDHFKGALKDRMDGNKDSDTYKLGRISIDQRSESPKDFLTLLSKTSFLK